MKSDGSGAKAGAGQGFVARERGTRLCECASPVHLVPISATSATHPTTLACVCALLKVSMGLHEGVPPMVPWNGPACMGCSLNGAMQGPVMVHHPRGHMCAAEGLHCGAAWRHGTAQRPQAHISRAARTRHEITIESPTYKLICGYSIVYPASVLYSN